MLKRFGITVPQTNARIRNVAAVMVTATIPTFMKTGSKVDVTVSAIGDARSLQGGVLIMSPLTLSDGTIVGMAQGPVSVGGWDYQALGSRVSRNFVTSGRVPNGLILEIPIENQIIQNQQLKILLRDPDFTTSTRVATAITNLGGGITATAQDAGTVLVQLPAGQNQGQNMANISQIESLQVQSDPVARVVINERTGTIVVGGSVELLPAVVAHGGLEISIQKQVIVQQPAPFTIRPPTPVETAEITTQEQVNPANGIQITQPVTVQNMAQALNDLKVTPRDLISIFQALKEAGSLQGELIIQ